MAHASDESYGKFLRFFAIVVVISVTGSVIGLKLYVRIQRNSSANPLCPPCACACSSRSCVPHETGSVENDPAIREEMQMDVQTLIKEQLELTKIMDKETLRRKEVVIRNVKNSTESFRREAERCRAGVLTCEEAREKAEADSSSRRSAQHSGKSEPPKVVGGIPEKYTPEMAGFWFTG